MVVVGTDAGLVRPYPRWLIYSISGFDTSICSISVGPLV
eukprot:SAG31_NODE_1125_length_9770_cov_2.732499_6_plen_39_part_00